MDERDILNGPDSKPTFGQLFRQYREGNQGGEKVTQMKAASILGIEASTLSKIESGTRRPPRTIEFYARLRNLPNISEEEIKALLQRTPAILTRGKQSFFVTDAVHGQQEGVSFSWHIESRRLLRDYEIEGLNNVIKGTFRVVIGDFLAAKRSKKQ